MEIFALSVVKFFRKRFIFFGSQMAGKNEIPDCLAAAIAILVHLSFVCAGCFTVRSKMIGTMRSTPSSVHFAIIQSNRFPFGMLAAMVMRFVWGRVMVWRLATSAVTSERVTAVTFA